MGLRRSSEIIVSFHILEVSLRPTCGNPAHAAERRYQSGRGHLETCGHLVSGDLWAKVRIQGTNACLNETEALRFVQGRQSERLAKQRYPQSNPGEPYGLFNIPVAAEFTRAGDTEPYRTVYLSAAYEQTQERRALITRHLESFGDWTGAANEQQAKLQAAHDQLLTALATYEVGRFIAAERAEIERVQAEKAMAEDQRRITGDVLTPTKQTVTEQLLGDVAGLISTLEQKEDDA